MYALWTNCHSSCFVTCPGPGYNSLALNFNIPMAWFDGWNMATFADDYSCLCENRYLLVKEFMCCFRSCQIFLDVSLNCLVLVVDLFLYAIFAIIRVHLMFDLLWLTRFVLRHLQEGRSCLAYYLKKWVYI